MSPAPQQGSICHRVRSAQTLATRPDEEAPEGLHASADSARHSWDTRQPGIEILTPNVIESSAKPCIRCRRSQFIAIGADRTWAQTVELGDVQ
jgi:hypothetical protein